MNLPQKITKGTRFVMHDTEYEIQYVHNDNVRYSTINGGKTFSLPAHQYNSLLDSKSISVTHEAKLVIHEDNIKELTRKMRYVRDILTRSGSYLKKGWVINIIKNTAEELQDTQPPSYHTVRRWVRIFQKHGQDGLIPLQNGNSSARYDAETHMIISEEIENALKKGFVLIGVEIHSTVVNRLLTTAREQNSNLVKIPSLRLIQRTIKSLDYYHKLIAKHGKSTANRLIRASGKKIIVPGPMTVVQIDTHYLDVIVVDPDTMEPIGRPYLVLIICVHTKRVVGHFISLFPPSATTTLQAVKLMLEHFGLPSLIIPDRGVEFINTGLFLLCTYLSITLELSQVREPNHKSNVESLFRTITKYLIQRLKGTTFSNVLERGDYDSEAEAIFTLDQVKSFVDIWINEVYDKKPHSQTKRAPIAMWEKAIAEEPIFKIENEEIENLARKPELKTVHRGRVMINNLTYYSHALTEFDGKKLTVLVDEMDLATVYVKDPEDPKTLIRADSTEPHYTTGLTLNQHLLVQEELKQLSAAEMASIGEHSWQLGQARLMDRMLDDALSNKQKKKALNGKSVRDTQMHKKTNELALTNAEVPVGKPPKAKNQPKASGTRNPTYTDSNESVQQPGEVVEYTIFEI